MMNETHFLTRRAMQRSLVVFGLAGVAMLTTVGCSTDADSPDETSTSAAPTLGALEVSPGEPTATDSAGGGAAPAAQDAVEGELITADGMPEVPLYGCETLLEASVNETDFDTQWTWEFECRSAEPFNATVDAMNAGSGWTHTVDAPGGNPDYLTDKHHYIAEWDGVALDVDLSAIGEPSELEVTYVVTLAKP